jgi:hypothetical protein
MCARRRMCATDIHRCKWFPQDDLDEVRDQEFHTLARSLVFYYYLVCVHVWSQREIPRIYKMECAHKNDVLHIDLMCGTYIRSAAHAAGTSANYQIKPHVPYL